MGYKTNHRDIGWSPEIVGIYHYISMPFVYPILWPFFIIRNTMTNHRILAYAQFWTKLSGWMMFFFGIFGDSESLPSPLSTRCWRASAAMFGSPEQLAPGTPKAWCFLWLPSELRKTSEDLQYDVYNIFSIYYIHILIISIISYHIQDLWSYTFNIFQYYIHNLFKTSRVRFSRRETNGRSSTSDFAAATTSGSSIVRHASPDLMVVSVAH